jgi:hypothetical protein
MRKAIAFSLVGLLAVPPAGFVLAGNWPGWRGPTGTGVSPEDNLPTEWGREKNVRWRVDLPGPGNASPIVWGDRVFVAQAVAEGNRRTLICFDRKTGKQLWQSGVAYAEKEPTHETNPYAAGTPATDGQRVYACFGSAGVFAYDLDGKELWRRDLGKLNHMFGNAISPVLHGDLCILNYGPDMARGGRLVALNKATGEVAWEAEPPKVDPASGGGGPRKPPGMGIMLAGSMVLAGDANKDEEMSKPEFAALAEAWFAKLDADKAGTLTAEQFANRLDGVLPPPPGMGNPPPKPPAGGGRCGGAAQWRPGRAAGVHAGPVPRPRAVHRGRREQGRVAGPRRARRVVRQVGGRVGRRQERLAGRERGPRRAERRPAVDVVRPAAGWSAAGRGRQQSPGRSWRPAAGRPAGR